MAVTNITYATDTSLAVTAWGTSLIAGDFATSAIYDNTSTLYVDVFLGGVVELGATTPVVGDTMDIYIVGQYSETAADMTGGIDALLTAATERTADTHFVTANMIFMKSVAVEATTPAVAQGYQWGPIGVAQFFGGVMPKRFMLMMHNNTAGIFTAGSDVNVTGITYTTA